LAFVPAVGKITNIEKQDFDHGLVLRKDLAIGDVLVRLRIQAFNGISGVNDAAQLDRVF
jgi:hypothetical protein